MQSLFIGPRDTDAYILSKLSLIDLRRLCQSNDYLSNLCQTDIFIKSRLKEAHRRVDQLMSIFTKTNNCDITT